MNRRPTIKDIAREAGVSTGTVHLVLHDKKGVGAETRERVQAVAQRMGYRLNVVASSLKRGRLRIAVALPVKSGMNRFYFSYLWDGVRDAIERLSDYNAELIPAPYYGAHIVPDALLRHILDDIRPDGLICAGYFNPQSPPPLALFEAAGIPVVLLGAEAEELPYLCAVMPPYEILGQMLAEQLYQQTRDKLGAYIIGVGSASIQAHTRVVDGFMRQMKDCGRAGSVVQVSTESLESQSAPFVRELQRGQCIGCCAVTARDSLALTQALRETTLAGTLPAIGSDVFLENVAALRDGTLTNLIQKNPYQQALVATQILTEYLMSGKKPDRLVVHVGAEMVFRSTLPLYENGFYRLLA